MSEHEQAAVLRRWLISQERRPTRMDMAWRYAQLVRLPYREGGVSALNEAIARRWSWSGLDYIKKRAWQIVESVEARQGEGGRK